jgi:peptide/nickel transport system substrate-binding protein
MFSLTPMSYPKLFLIEPQILFLSTLTYIYPKFIMMRYQIQILIVAICVLVGQSCETGKKELNQLNIRIEGEPSVLNPYLASTGYSRQVSSMIFQTLASLDQKTFTLLPTMINQIPTIYTVADGPKKGLYAYDFVLRDQATWDNGTPITANDMVFTLKVILNPFAPTPYASYFETLHSVDIDPSNPKKFTAYFKEYYLLTLESMCQVAILPAYQYDQSKQIEKINLESLIDQSATKTADSTALRAFTTQFQDPKFSTDLQSISGSGPYRVESIQPGEGLTLALKPNYWGNALAGQLQHMAANPDKIKYRVIKDEAAVESHLRNQEIDLGMILNPTKFLDLQKDADLAKNYTFATQPTFQFGYWMLNLRMPIFKDNQVRKALAHLVNYDFLYNDVYQKLAERTIGPISPLKEFYNKDIKPYPFDINAAIALLEAAGWKDTDGDGIREKIIAGKKTKLAFKLMTSNVAEVSKRTAESIKEECRKAGIQIDLDLKDLKLITKETTAGTFETAILAAANFPGESDLYQYYHSKSQPPNGDNRSGYLSATADSLIDQIRHNPDATSRLGQYHRLQATLYHDLPHIYLFVPRQRYFVHNRYEPFMSPGRPGYIEPLFKLK